MELLRSFYRKKQFKIYTLIITLMITSLIILLSFISYYKEVVNDCYEYSMYTSFASKYNYTDLFAKEDLIRSTKIGLLLIPDYNNGNIEKQDYQTGNTSFYWDKFLLGINVDAVGLFRGSDFSIEVEDNKIVIGYSSINLGEGTNYEDLDIIGEKLDFYTVDNNSYSFEVQKVVDMNNATLFISDKTFELLDKNIDLYTYRLTYNDYEKMDEVDIILDSLDYEEEYEMRTFYIHVVDAENVKSLISFLKIGGYLIIIFLIIIVILIINNIIKDEKRNIYIERIVGYNKLKISKYLIINLTFLTSICYLFALTLSNILLIILKYVFELNIIIFDYEIQSFIITILFIILLVEAFIFKIKISKNLKELFLEI